MISKSPGRSICAIYFPCAIFSEKPKVYFSMHGVEESLGVESF